MCQERLDCKKEVRHTRIGTRFVTDGFVKRHCVVCIALVSIAQFPMQCLASDAPAALRGRTIQAIYSWLATAHSEYGQVGTNARENSLTIYVSSLGRIFVKGRSQNNRGSVAIIAAPSQQFRFQGDAIVGVFQNLSGASQLTISFSPDFKSCNLTAMAGKENGKPFTWIGTDGAVWATIEPMKFTATGCSIKDGNALAN
jgi:hypothetical protein